MQLVEEKKLAKECSLLGGGYINLKEGSPSQCPLRLQSYIDKATLVKLKQKNRI